MNYFWEWHKNIAYIKCLIWLFSCSFKHFAVNLNYGKARDGRKRVAVIREFFTRISYMMEKQIDTGSTKKGHKKHKVRR